MATELPGDDSGVALDRVRFPICYTKAAGRSNRGQICLLSVASYFHSCVFNETPWLSELGLKVQIRIRNPADNLRLKRRPRREFQDKVLVETLTVWNSEIHSERPPWGVAAQGIRCPQIFAFAIDAGNAPL